MTERLRVATHWINAYRITVAPVLAYLIWTDDLNLLRYFLAVSLLAGLLVKKWGLPEKGFDALITAVADDLTMVLALLGMIIFFPAFMQDNFAPIAGLMALYLIKQALVSIRFGQPQGYFYAYSVRLSALLQVVLIMLLFFLPGNYQPLFYLACVATGMSSLAGIFLQIADHLQHPGGKQLMQ